MQKKSPTIADDVTVELGNSNTTTEFKNVIRMTMIFKISCKKYGCNDKDVPLVEILKIVKILKLLTNKLPYRVGPWNTINLAYIDPKEEGLLTILREGIDFVELYVSTTTYSGSR